MWEVERVKEIIGEGGGTKEKEKKKWGRKEARNSTEIEQKRARKERGQRQER